MSSSSITKECTPTGKRRVHLTALIVTTSVLPVRPWNNIWSSTQMRDPSSAICVTCLSSSWFTWPSMRGLTPKNGLTNAPAVTWGSINPTLWGFTSRGGTPSSQDRPKRITKFSRSLGNMPVFRCVDSVQWTLMQLHSVWFSGKLLIWLRGRSMNPYWYLGN